MPFGSSQWMYASGADFYNGVATQSLRFDSSGSAYLSQSPAQTGDSNKTFTFSCWVKRCAVGTEHVLFSAGANASSATGIVYFYFSSSDTLAWYTQMNGSANAHYITSAKYRDTSAWYHVALVEVSATSHKIYVNGVEQDYATTTAGTDKSSAVGTTEIHTIGRRSWTASSYLNGYMAEVNFLDGITVGETDGYLDEFGELKNGAWIPKAYTGSYGTNGFRLEFKDNTNDSANSNNYTANSVSTQDYVPDCPENNFPTMNSLSKSQGTPAFAEGNLRISTSSTAYSYFPCNFAVKTGKWYAEYRVVTVGSTMIGIAESNMEAHYTGAENDPHLTAGTVWYAHGGGGYFDGSSNPSLFGDSYTNGDIISIRLDLDSATRNVKLYKNNVEQADINLTANFSDHILFASNFYGTTAGVWNFGQDPSFAGGLTGGDIGTETPSEGAGVFKYAVPSGFKALCSANISDDDLPISPNADTQADDYFNTVTYTGTGASPQSVTGAGFQPDWIWIKNRSSGYSHVQQDVVRGFGELSKMSSNSSNAEGTSGVNGDNYGHVSTSDTDGFTVTHTINASDDGGTIRKGTHYLNDTYVGWCWKAGGTAVSNTQGSINSSVSANTDAGFSIVTWSGNETSGATIGHGLNLAPEMIITKCRSHATSWVVGIGNVSGFSTNDYLTLNTANQKGSSSTFYQGYGATTFTVGVSGADEMNRLVSSVARTYVSYCFHSVDGFSKFGNYTGNGDTSGNGTFVYLGFRPAFIMYKRTDTTGNWLIDDNKTSPYNPDSNYLLAENPGYEGDTGTNVAGHIFDHLSNGFKFRNYNSARNASGGSYVYMAFAETPFKYANAR